MKYRICSFVLLMLAGCGTLVMDAGSDAAPLLDASAAALDGDVPADAARPSPDSGTPCGGAVLALRDLGSGAIGEEVALTIGTMSAQTCPGELDDHADVGPTACEPASLWVDDGLGVDGSLIGGDPYVGYDHVTLALTEPARLQYATGDGEDYADGEGDFVVRHRVRAYLAGELVHEATPEGHEFTSPVLPLADRIVWSALEIPGPYYADAYELVSITSSCPRDVWSWAIEQQRGAPSD